MLVGDLRGFQAQNLKIGESFMVGEVVRVENSMCGGGEKVYRVLGNLRSQIYVCEEGVLALEYLHINNACLLENTVQALGQCCRAD